MDNLSMRATLLHKLIYFFYLKIFKFTTIIFTNRIIYDILKLKSG